MVAIRGKAKRKHLDLNARAVPVKAKVLFGLSLVAAAGTAVHSYQRIDNNDYEQTDLGAAVLAAPAFLACLIPCVMMWRDEIELHDGSLMGGFAVLAAAGQLIMSLSVGLEWAGAILLAAAHGVLAARNAKGLRVAWLKQGIPHGRATELMVGFGCAAGIQGVLSLGHVQHGYGLVTTWALAAVYAAATANMLTATFATYSERFPKINSAEMWNAAAVLWAAESARGASLAFAHWLQVACSCAASVLFALGIGMAAIAAYRRTILRSKNTI